MIAILKSISDTEIRLAISTHELTYMLIMFHHLWTINTILLFVDDDANIYQSFRCVADYTCIFNMILLYRYCNNDQEPAAG